MENEAAATNGRLGYINAKQEAAAGCGDVHSRAEALKCTRDHADKTTTIPGLRLRRRH